MLKVNPVIVFLVTVLISVHAQSGEIADADVRAEIIALDDAWINAEVSHDQAALEDILDEQFLVIYPSGRTGDRTDFISRVMSSDIPPFEVIHEEIRVHGNTVVVVDSSTDGKKKYTWVAVSKGQSWKVVSEVFSKVAQAN
jgi:hypothetical protein